MILNGDSLVLITPAQVRDLNLFKSKCDECQELNIHMQELDEIRESQLSLKDSVISNKDQQLNIFQQRVDLAQGTIINLGIVAKRAEKANSWLKWQRNVLVGIAIGLITYILITK